jgi:2-polyprenyl-3-methyl-5-hydroxy-6-metoxy-1,4-benzoquinol methylase
MNSLTKDPGQWRKQNLNRPWYRKAIELLPNLKFKKVLELGSGNGELASVLKSKAINLTCSDNSPIYVKNLKKYGLKAIKTDFNLPLPFDSNQFDLVISLEVIEHLYQAENFLSEIHRILKPKGQLIISTPNIAWWGYRFYMLLGQPPKKEGYHLRFFTHHTLTKLLAKSGLKIIESNSFCTIPFINRILPKPIYPTISFWPNFIAQDLVFLCQKKHAR